MSQWNYLRNEKEIVDSLWREWNGSEDIDITKFSKISLKIAIVFFLNFFFAILRG